MRRADHRPCEQLKALRERSGLTAADIGRQLGYRSPSAYPRYENVEKQGDKLIPYHLIRQLIPLFVGRGQPPITHDELLAVSEAPHREGPPSMTGQHSIGGNPTPLAFASTPYGSKLALRVRVRAERGVFVAKDSGAKDYGYAPVSASSEYAAEEQFCVVVMDGHAEEFGFPNGTVLHCVGPDQFTNEERLERKKVLLWSQKDSTGLGEMVITRFRGKDGAGVGAWICEDASGAPIAGHPVGVIVRSLRYE